MRRIRYGFHLELHYEVREPLRLSALKSKVIELGN